MSWHRAAKEEDLVDGQVSGVNIGGQKIALYKIDGKVFATADICTHEYALLSEGYLDGDCVECPLHAAVFHVPTGAVKSGPTSCALQIFPVKLEDGVVLVELAG